MGIHQLKAWQNGCFEPPHRQPRELKTSAYCLMGIFDVNLPLLYGEGEKAFLRLQEEVARQSDDHTLFAWNATTHCRCQLCCERVLDESIKSVEKESDTSSQWEYCLEFTCRSGYC